MSEAERILREELNYGPMNFFDLLDRIKALADKLDEATNEKAEPSSKK